MASDLVDGQIDRRLGTAGSRGALIDAACDFLVVMSAGIAAGLSDARYAGLAAVMAVAFLSYGALSLIIGRFAYTRLGRYDGAVSYGVVAVAAGKALPAVVGLTVPSAAEWVFLCLSALVLAVSAVENVAGILAARDRNCDSLPWWPRGGGDSNVGVGAQDADSQHAPKSARGRCRLLVPAVSCRRGRAADPA